MDTRWEKALAWYDTLPMGRRKVEYNTTIRRALAQLQQVTSLQDLQTTYDAGLQWVVDLAREGFPDTPPLWATERTADVAFGLRARQLLSVPPSGPARP